MSKEIIEKAKEEIKKALNKHNIEYSKLKVEQALGNIYNIKIYNDYFELKQLNEFILSINYVTYDIYIETKKNEVMINFSIYL